MLLVLWMMIVFSLLLFRCFRLSIPYFFQDHFVRTVHILKEDRGIGVAGCIRMKLFGESPIGGFDLCHRGVSRDAQDLVEIGCGC